MITRSSGKRKFQYHRLSILVVYPKNQEPTGRLWTPGLIAGSKLNNQPTLVGTYIVIFLEGQSAESHNNPNQRYVQRNPMINIMWSQFFYQSHCHFWRFKQKHVPTQLLIWIVELYQCWAHIQTWLQKSLWISSRISPWLIYSRWYLDRQISWLWHPTMWYPAVNPDLFNGHGLKF